MSEKEKKLLNACQVAASDYDARLFRNNVGVFWAGIPIRAAKPMPMMVKPGDVLLRKARMLRTGLCEGSADLIGWRTVTITPEMVGRQVAVFAAIEVKTESTRMTPAQAAFGGLVRSMGGLAEVVRDAGELEAALVFLK